MSKKSIDRITEVLLEGMETEPFSEITISELCTRAKIARKTFYNHFKTKDEVLSRVCSGIIDEYMIYSEVNMGADCERWLIDLAYHFFRVNKRHQDFLTLLFQQKLFHIYTQELQQRVIKSEYIMTQSTYFKLDPLLQPFVIPTYTASILTIYELWYHRDFAETTDEMAEIYLNIVRNTI